MIELSYGICHMIALHSLMSKQTKKKSYLIFFVYIFNFNMTYTVDMSQTLHRVYFIYFAHTLLLGLYVIDFPPLLLTATLYHLFLIVSHGKQINLI